MDLKDKSTKSNQQQSITFDEFTDTYKCLRVVQNVEQFYEITSIFDFANAKPTGELFIDNLENAHTVAYQLIERATKKVLVESTEHSDIREYIRDVLNLSIHR